MRLYQSNDYCSYQRSICLYSAHYTNLSHANIHSTNFDIVLNHNCLGSTQFALPLSKIDATLNKYRTQSSPETHAVYYCCLKSCLIVFFAKIPISISNHVFFLFFSSLFNLVGNNIMFSISKSKLFLQVFALGDFDFITPSLPFPILIITVIYILLNNVFYILFALYSQKRL